MKKNVDPKIQILDSAMEEFSQLGLAGGRVDRIAKRAGVNKAMLYYYFHSKEGLFKEVLRSHFSQLIPLVVAEIREPVTPQTFLERIPRLYIGFFRKNPRLIRLVALNLATDLKVVSTLFSSLLNEVTPEHLALSISNKIALWSSQGLLRQNDPMQIMINILSLCTFFFLAKPMVEVAFDRTIPECDEFYEKRIESVVSLLKGGLLP